jgi:carbon-monoxide dehydrogenase large subunit
MAKHVMEVGDPVACVIAETAIQAKDAAEAVVIDIDPLPAVTTARKAAEPGAPALYDNVPSNVALDFHFGKEELVAEAFAKAAHVTRLDIRNNRIVVATMEPRSALAHYDQDSQRFTMRIGCQGAFGMRRQLANLLKVEPEQVRVLTGNVGGSFGMKSFVYPEYICLMHATRLLNRPVKWTDERSSAFLSDQQGRDHEVGAELALDTDGRFLAVRLNIHANLGGYLTAVGPNMATNNAVKNITSVTFGGEDMDALYVTTMARIDHPGAAAHGRFAVETSPQFGAGSLFKVTGLGIRGIPEPRFGG